MLIALNIFVLGTAATIALFYRLSQTPARVNGRLVDERMRSVAARSNGEVAPAAASLLKQQGRGMMRRLERAATKTSSGSAFKTWVEQSGINMAASAVLLLIAAAAVTAATLSTAIRPNPFVAVLAAWCGAAVPIIVIKRIRNTRLRRFEEFFPDALDLMARTLRAGHGFTTGLKTVADETIAPVGPEFRKAFDEQNFGLPPEEVLDNLQRRVPLLDVRFFATAVLIQRQSGGNLAEIFDTLALVVRERFKVRRQVRIVTAHGRLTGHVLTALPAVLAIVLTAINPEHMSLLFRTPVGQGLLAGAAIMQVVGYLWIRRIVNIEV